MDVPANPVALFQELVETLRRRGAPDAHRAALGLLAGEAMDDLHPPIPEARLRAVLEETRPRLPETLDRIALSGHARRGTGALTTPDIAQLLVDLVMESACRRALVLQDPFCLVSSRLARNGLTVDQHEVQSDLPGLCVAIAGMPAWTLAKETQARSPGDTRATPRDDGPRRFFDAPDVRPEDETTAIAVLPRGPGVSGSSSFKQLPYAAAEDLTALLAGLGPAVSRVMALVPSSMLYRTGKAEAFRDQLVTSGLVEAVLELPDGATPLATHHYSVVILRRSGELAPERAILAMRLPERISPGTRGRGRRIEVVTSPAAARRVIRQCLDDKTDHGRIVTPAHVRRVRSLLPRTLLADPEPRGGNARDSVRLAELVRVVRPAASKAGARRPRASITTAGIGEACPYVRLAIADGEHENAPAELKAHETTAELQPGDILVVVKGSVGALALVESATHEPVLLPASCLVLRPKAAHHACAIYLALKSRSGTDKLRQIATGSTVRNIRVSDLNDLAIPYPDAESCSAADRTLGAVAETTRRIEQLEKQRARLLHDATAR